MTTRLDRARLESLRADLAGMLAEADTAGAHVLAVHLSLAMQEVEDRLADDENG